MPEKTDPSDFVIDRHAAMAMVTRSNAVESYRGLQSALGNEGYLFGVPSDYKLRRLKKLLGTSRYQHTQRIQDERDRFHEQGRFGNAPSETVLYSLLKTAEEAHVFYSIQSETSLIGNAAAYDAVIRQLPQGATVADLGCFTGSFVRFVATQHPTYQLYGYDKLSHLITIAESINRPLNATFHTWDYLTSSAHSPIKANGIVCVLGLALAELLPPQEVGSLPSSSLQPAPDPHTLSLVSRAARNWSTIAASGAKLCVVARAGTPGLMLAITEGCQAAGWRLAKPATKILAADGESVPLFVFDQSSTLHSAPGLSQAEAEALWIAGLIASQRS